MLDRAQAAHVAVNGDIVGRIGENEVGSVACHHLVHVVSIARIAAE